MTGNTPATRPPVSWRRLRGLLRKEILQILRDPSSIAIAFVMPAVLLFLFGYGVSLDAKHVPIAVVIESPSQEATSFAGSFMASEYFEPVIVPGRHAAEEALVGGDVRAMVVLRSDFAERLRSPAGAPIQLVVNGTDSNTARIVIGYVEGALARWVALRGEGKRMQSTPSVVPEQRVWFNAEVRSQNYLVPGLIAINMTLTGALLTALVIAREWERGTMEALMATPVGVNELLVGKIVPYFALGMGGMALSTAIAVWVFDVPLRGSLWVLLGTSSLFLLTALGMGLLISTLARNQFVAGQLAIIVTFLPAFMLSGFQFDIDSAPAAVQVVTYLVPARHFVSSLQTLFLAGDVWSVVLPNALALAVMAAALLLLTRLNTRKSIE